MSRIWIEASVVPARPPTRVRFSYLDRVEAEARRVIGQSWLKRNNEPRIEIAVRPAVQALTDTGRHRMVDVGMA